MSASLAAAALLDAVSLALYLIVGRRVVRILGDRLRAGGAFALFWIAVGIVNGLNAALEGWAVVADPGRAVAFAVWNTRIALALAGFAGLVYYLLCVYVGRRGLLVAVAAFYILTFALMQAWLIESEPVGASIGAWRVGLDQAGPDEGPLYTLIVALFFVPPLLASAGYALLLRHVEEPLQRRRVRLLSLALVGYFLGLLLGYLNLGWYWWGLAENLLGIAVAAVALQALPRGGAR